MCFRVTRLDRKCVLRTSAVREATTTNPHTFNSIFEKCSFRNRLLFHFACSTNSRAPNTVCVCVLPKLMYEMYFFYVGQNLIRKLDS